MMQSSRTPPPIHRRTPPRHPRCTTPFTLPGTSGANSSTVRRKRIEPYSTPIRMHDDTPSKTVYFIRHGQSMAQAAGYDARLVDPSLLDCGLSPLGVEECRRLPHLLDVNSIDLVVCSPLTRALQTAVIAFPDKPILIHYDLRELGNCQVPENVPRDIRVVLSDLRQCGCNLSQVDSVTLRPPNWPRRHDASPRVVRRDRIRNVVRDFVAQRPERVIAVVAHFNVIETALAWNLPQSQTERRPYRHHLHPLEQVCPRNAVPIPCRLDSMGLWLLEDEVASPPPDAPPVASCVHDSLTFKALPVSGTSNDDHADSELSIMKPITLDRAFVSS